MYSKRSPSIVGEASRFIAARPAPPHFARLSRRVQLSKNSRSVTAPARRCIVRSLTGRMRSISTPMGRSWMPTSTAPRVWLRLNCTSGCSANSGLPYLL